MVLTHFQEVRTSLGLGPIPNLQTLMENSGEVLRLMHYRESGVIPDFCFKQVVTGVCRKVSFLMINAAVYLLSNYFHSIEHSPFNIHMPFFRLESQSKQLGCCVSLNWSRHWQISVEHKFLIECKVELAREVLAIDCNIQFNLFRALLILDFPDWRLASDVIRIC